MSPKNQFDANVHYQLRLVKRIDGGRIVTHGPLAQPKGLGARDKTVDFGTEKGALQAARNYSKRGERRKGPLPGDYMGAVVTKFVTDAARFGAIKPGNVPGGFILTNRSKRLEGTTTWLYYVDPDGKAFHVSAETHRVGGAV